MPANLDLDKTFAAGSIRFLWVMITALAAWKCGASTAPQSRRCDVERGPRSEFLPEGCAVLRGTALDSLGVPLRGQVVVVETTSGSGGGDYFSDAAVVGGDGVFELVVFRSFVGVPNSLRPDTASVDLKLYSAWGPNIYNERPRASVVHTFTFAKLGSNVPVRTGTFRFPVRMNP